MSVFATDVIVIPV